MAQIKVTGDAMVITSALSLETIESLNKLSSDSLILKSEATASEEAYPIFVIGSRAGSEAVFDSRGIRFTGKNTEGKATATILMPSNMSAEKREEYIKDRYTTAIARLLKAEEVVAAAAVVVKAERDSAYAAIEIED